MAMFKEYKKITAILLIVLLIVPTAFSLRVQNVQAHGPVTVVGGPGTAADIAIKAIEQVANQILGSILDGTSALVVKEYVLDPIAWSIVKQIIRGLTQNIVNWINSGFNGNPFYITNLESYLVSICNATVNQFFNELGSAASGLDPVVKTLIAQSISRSNTCSMQSPLGSILQPTISSSAYNAFNNDFRNGGWNMWILTTTRPQNNPYGQYFLTSNELVRRKRAVEDLKRTQLDYNRGFLSWKQCADTQGSTDSSPAGVTAAADRALSGGGTCSRYEVVTPGIVIERQLGNVLGSGLRQLELADELDEIINALVAQLIQQVFTDSGGLRGVSSGGSASYINQLGSGAVESDATFRSTKAFATEQVDNALSIEGDFRTAKVTSLNQLLSAENLLHSLISCYEGKISDTSLNLTSSEKATAQQRITNAQSAINTQITPDKNRLTAEIAEIDALINELKDIRAGIQLTQSTEELDVEFSNFRELQNNGELHDFVDVLDAKTEADDITSRMQTLNSVTQSRITECNRFPVRPITPGGPGGGACVPSPGFPCS